MKMMTPAICATGVSAMTMSDDFVPLNLGFGGEKLPIKPGLIGLVDADTIAFTACLQAQAEEFVGPAWMTSEEEVARLRAEPTYNPDTDTYMVSDLGACVEIAVSKLNKIKQATGVSDFELYFTGPTKECFRYRIYNAYKQTRVAQRPLYLQETKEELCKLYKGQICSEVEADDAVLYYKRNYPDMYLLICLDKDVYNATPGWHFNYYESAKFNKSMHFVEINEQEALRWPFMQALMGDKSDNIIGLYGIGAAKAAKLMPLGLTETDYWRILIEEFVKAGKTRADAVLNYNLVYCGNCELQDAELKWKGEIDAPL